MSRVEQRRFTGRPWRWLTVAVALAALAAACGGNDETEATASNDDSEEVAATSVPQTPTALPEIPTSTPAPDPTSDPTAVPISDDEPAEEETDDDLVNADPVLVDLANFRINVATTTYKAGMINFEVRNSDDISHEFGIARGASYEDLPQLANGSIDEEALGADFLGKTAIVDSVLSPLREISYDLKPGQYVFYCNLVIGPVSHAARGQVLSVTVVG